MNDDRDAIVIRELLLGELSPAESGDEGWLHGPFRALHAEWRARGVSRWLDLVRRDGPHPVVVFGAFVDRVAPRLVGAVVGVWAPSPIDRFDDLFERASGHAATSRPAGGAWHLVAVTTDPASELRGRGLARLLLGHALAWARERGHACVRTLSPAIGLAELAGRWPHDTADAVARAARPDDGRPYLQVVRLHLGGGATLERVLEGSRRDDRASAGVTLRFLYPTDTRRRVTQRELLQRWYELRARVVRAGAAEAFAPDVVRVVTALDASFVPDVEDGLATTR